MRALIALVAAVGVAAVLFALELIVEGFQSGARLTLSSYLVLVLFSFVVGFIVALCAGMPLWMILRSRGVRSLAASISIGTALGLATDLFFVAGGIGAPSDGHCHFSRTLGRLFRLCAL